MSRRARRGVMLVMAGTLAVLLLLMALGFSLMARFLSRRASAVSAQARAGLCAVSGMEYAALRLAGEVHPRESPVLSMRGDIWLYREGPAVPLARARHPSYGRGEPWLDGGNGLWESGEGIADLDGDRDLTPWSGRIRGEGPFGTRFALKIESLEGRIPVNAGMWEGLDLDLDGGLSPAEQVQSLNREYLKGLVHVLNNLGVIRGVSARRWTPANASGEPVTVSWLGYDLVRHRPLGGYRSWSEARSALQGLGYGYTASDLEAIRPFVDLGGYDGLAESGRAASGDGPSFPPYSPVCLMSAPRDVLRAHWMYLSSFFDAAKIPGEAGAWSAPYPRSGALGVAFSQALWMIYPEEADRLADLAMRLRRAGPVGWRALYAEISREAGSALFQEDVNALPPAAAVARRSWAQGKADLAFQAVAMDPYPYLRQQRGGPGIFEIPGDALTTWAGWGIDRDPDAPGVQQSAFVSFESISRVRHPKEYAAADPQTFQAEWTSTGVSPIPYRTYAGRIKPQGFTLAPPQRFAVESLGLAGIVSVLTAGEIRTCDRIELSSQEDFEHWDGGGRLARRGIRTVDETTVQQRHDVKEDPGTEGLGLLEGPRTFPHVATLPRPSLWGFRAQGTGSFSRCYGAVALAPREIGRQEAELYWPLSEDYDGAPNLAGGLPGTEGWSLGPGGTIRMDVDQTLTADQERFNPYALTGRPSGSNGLGGWVVIPSQPWFKLPGGAYQNSWLDALSIEARMGPDSSVTLGSATRTLPGPKWSVQHTLEVATCRAPPPSRPEWEGTQVRVSIRWNNAAVGNSMMISDMRYFVRDRVDATQRAHGSRHMVVTLKRHEVPSIPPTGEVEVRIQVDGSDQADAATTPWDPAAWTVGPVQMRYRHRQFPAVEGYGDVTISHDVDAVWSKLRLRIEAADEVRLYGTEIPDAWVDDRHRLGSFAQGGTFTSPTYVLGEPASLRMAQWTGKIPDLFPPDAIEVRVEGFATAPGDPGHPAAAPGFPRLLGLPDEVSILDGAELGEVRSFRLKARFDVSGAAIPIDDTPVFESIWIAYRQRTRATAWTRWELR